MKYLKLLALPLIFALLSGCALFQEQIAKSAETLGKGLAEYCANMPDSERPAFRAAIEAECNCEIVLTCPGQSSQLERTTWPAFAGADFSEIEPSPPDRTNPVETPRPDD